MSEPRRPWEPLQPSTPKTGEPGRLSLHSPLRAGWPCRHCGHPLGLVRNWVTGQSATIVACCHCDNPQPEGTPTP